MPNAANLALWSWDKEADSLHDFVPNYLKRVEAEENWLKRITPNLASLILNAYDRNQRELNSNLIWLQPSTLLWRAVYPVSPWTLEQIQADLSQDQTWYALAYDGPK